MRRSGSSIKAVVINRELDDEIRAGVATVLGSDWESLWQWESTKEFLKMKKVCGLWLQKAKSGKNFYRGKAEDGTVYLLFKNDDKKNPKAPDLQLNIKVDDEAPAKSDDDGEIPF